MRESEPEFSLKEFFLHLTTRKAVSIIVILGFIVFGNALFNHFVWDDFPFILQNSEIHTINIDQILSVSRFNSAGYYRPIPALYFSLLYAAFGSQAFFYHFLQVSLHILNTIMLYLTFRRLLSRYSTKIETGINEKEWAKLSGSQRIKYLRKHRSQVQPSFKSDQKSNLLSFLLATLFLVHPINVESVAYIAASQSELFFLFGILAVFVSVKEKIYLKDLILVSGLSLLSLLTKETGFLFLLMILLFQYLFRRKKFSIFFIFEMGALFTYLFFRFAIGGIFFGKVITVEPNPLASMSLLERLASVPAIAFYYLSSTFFPAQLVFAQKWFITSLTFQAFYLPLLLDSLFFLALCMGGRYIYTHQRNYFKSYLFFFLWFLFGIGMLLQIFPLDLTVSDRWFYFPIVGVLGMLGVGIQIILFSWHKQGDASKNYEKAILGAAICGTVLILLLSIRSIVRNTNYKDEITLVTHDSYLQNNFIMEDTLGVDYAKAGNVQAALPHLQKSVKLYPYAANLFHLGLLYESVGKMQTATAYYKKAAIAAETASPTAYAHDLVDPQIYQSLAKQLLLSNDYEAARKYSKKGLQYDPNSRMLRIELALSENKLHHWQQAIDAFGAAISGSAPAQNNSDQMLIQILANKEEVPTNTFDLFLNQ